MKKSFYLAVILIIYVLFYPLCLNAQGKPQFVSAPEDILFIDLHQVI